jgi:hypothetical protein
MVRIAVQVTSGAARFSVAVQADSIERALEIVKRQNPRGVLRRGARRDVRARRAGEDGGVSWPVRDPGPPQRGVREHSKSFLGERVLRREVTK